ncbi:Protein BNI4 [Cladobotryum mycophilum]|uniref:Protein BNI4 n=1 Tax=Cladobotryum mycophilum TaxID=491253 RepID=A0ABR0SD05_9HYPO
MAALVQTYSQQSGTATMLQGRATPTSGMMPVGQPNPNHQYMGASNQAPRSAYHGVNAVSGYRGSTGPVQPYAFTTAPNRSAGHTQWQQPYPAYRTNSSPAVPSVQSVDPNVNHRSHRQNVSVTNMALLPSYGVGHGSSRDDSTVSQSRSVASSQSRPSHASTGSQSSLSIGGLSSKNGSDRHRRPSVHSSQHNRSGSTSQPTNAMAGKSSQIYHAPSGSRSVPNLSASLPSTENAHIQRRPSPDDPKKMRRRSVHSIEANDKSRPVIKGGDSFRTDSTNSVKSSDKNEKTPRIVPLPPKAAPTPTHNRNGSSDSVSSSRSNHSRTHSATNRNGPVPTGSPSLSASDEASTKNDSSKTLNIPSRGSSADGVKRTLSPSPLSKPATMANESASDSPASSAAPTASVPSSSNLNSPAAKHLAAINQKDGRSKSKTSRLRRAFSFGSAAEFRKAAGVEEEIGRIEPSKLHKDPTPEQAYDAEQARIAEAQEAGGIGTSIYGGRFFGSTDNLSISSTASSASIMIRKMGRGMKNRTRSLVGLFRPKSVIGVPAAESAVPEASEPTVSMINVEAETQRVNVTADPQHAKAGKGGTGFPHLERNSLDASQVPELGSERLGSSGTDNSAPRKSIVGGDRERAEVLAAVRKGILKRSSSPSIRPAESPELVLPSVPAITDSPNSSAPSTPVDDGQSHRRAGSIAIGNEDYFMSALRLRQDSRSRPGTPQAVAKRNATFSPRIVFHDTWPSQEYDRRGEIATCNRLTPMLAQQIKEELNSFKMEMEVHENSKIYTHFF